MRTVWKYEIPTTGLVVDLWEPAVVLVSQDPAGGDGPSVWIEHTVDPDPIVDYCKSIGHLPERRLYEVIGTGHKHPNIGRHVGSCVCKPYVWHVYETVLSADRAPEPRVSDGRGGWVDIPTLL